MHKKATKDVKEQLDAVEGPNEKIKFLQQKYLDKVHEANKLDKQNGTLQVRACRSARFRNCYLILMAYLRLRACVRVRVCGVAAIIGHVEPRERLPHSGTRACEHGTVFRTVCFDRNQAV